MKYENGQDRKREISAHLSELSRNHFSNQDFSGAYPRQFLNYNRLLHPPRWNQIRGPVKSSTWEMMPASLPSPRRKKPEIVNRRRVILQHDNVQLHAARKTNEKIYKLG